MDSNTSFTCKALRDSLQQDWLWPTVVKVVSTFLIACAMTGLPANVLLLITIPRVKPWPAHIRILLTNASIAMCLLELNYFFHWGKFDLPAALEIIPIPYKAGACATYEICHTFASAAAFFSFLGIATERWRSTSPTNLSVDSTFNFVFVVIVGSWLSAGATIGFLIWHSYTFLQKEMLCFCSILIANNAFILLCFVVVYVALESVLSYMFYSNLYKTRTRFLDVSINTAKGSLSERFLLSETIQLTEILFPPVLLHSVCWMTALLLTIPLVLFTEKHTYTQIALGMAVEGLFYMNAALHPCVLFWKTKHLRKYFWSPLCKAPTETAADGRLELRCNIYRNQLIWMDNT